MVVAFFSRPRVGRLPETLPDRFDMFELRHGDALPAQFRSEAAAASCSRARSGAHCAACVPPGAEPISRRIQDTSLAYSASLRR